MLNRIIKRDGTTVPFDARKIESAIFRAFRDVMGDHVPPDICADLTDMVCGVLWKSPGPHHVEQIQDVVEETLIRNGYAKTAKAYILYREDHAKIRRTGDWLMSLFKKLTYSDASDADIKRENANIDGDTAMGTMLKYGSESSKFFIDNYILPKDISAAHANGEIHI